MKNLPIILTACVLFGIVYSLGKSWQDHLLAHAVPVPVQVVATRIDWSFLGHDHYKPVIIYTYTFNGQTYISQTLNTPVAPWHFIFPMFWENGDPTFRTHERTAAFLANYATGKTSTGYLDPLHPEESFLEKGALL